MVVKALEFVFSDAWHFLGTVVMLVIMTMWKPIDITFIRSIGEPKDDD